MTSDLYFSAQFPRVPLPLSVVISLLPLLPQNLLPQKKISTSTKSTLPPTPMFLLTPLPLLMLKLPNNFRVCLKSIPLPVLLPELTAFSPLLADKSLPSHFPPLCLAQGCAWYSSGAPFMMCSRSMAPPGVVQRPCKPALSL